MKERRHGPKREELLKKRQEYSRRPEVKERRSLQQKTPERREYNRKRQSEWRKKNPERLDLSGLLKCRSKRIRLMRGKTRLLDMASHAYLAGCIVNPQECNLIR